MKIKNSNLLTVKITINASSRELTTVSHRLAQLVTGQITSLCLGDPCITLLSRIVRCRNTATLKPQSTEIPIHRHD